MTATQQPSVATDCIKCGQTILVYIEPEMLWGIDYCRDCFDRMKECKEDFHHQLVTKSDAEPD